MNISAPFIHRPVATTLLTLAVAIAGAIAFQVLPVSPLPQVDFPTISVQATLPGACPTELVEVISETLAICPRWRSSGLATLVATVSGPAPGRLACTEIVGKSTCGRGDTGNIRKATAPASAMATVSKVVATGRLIKTSEIFMG